MAKAVPKMDDVKRPEKITPSATSRPIIVTDGNALVGDPMLASSDTPQKGEPATAPVLSHTARTIMPLSDTAKADPVTEAPKTETAPETPKVPVSETSTDTSTGAEDKEPSDVIKTAVAIIEPVKKKALEPATKTDEPKEPAETPALETTSITEDQKPAVSPIPDTKPESTPPKLTPVEVPAAKEPTPDVPVAQSEAGDNGVVRDPDAAIKAEDTAAAEAKTKRAAELENAITSQKYFVPIDARAKRHSHMRSLFFSVVALILTVALVDAVLDVGLVRPPAGVPHTHFFSQ